MRILDARCSAMVMCLLAALLLLAGGTEVPGAAEPDFSAPLSVEDCVRIALEQSDQLAQAEANLRSTHGSMRISTSAYLPSASLSAAWSRQWPERTAFMSEFGTDPIIVKYDGNVGFSLHQNLVDLASYADIKSSRKQYAASSEEFKNTEADLIASTKQQFYTCLAAIKVADVEEEAVEVSREQLRRSETLFRLGSVARSDVLQARVNLAEAEQILIERRNGVRVELSRLAMDMGLDPRRDLMLDTTLVVPQSDPEGEMDSWISRALMTRPDLEAARGRVAAAEWAEKSAKLGRLPSISASYRWNTSGSSDDPWLEFDSDNQTSTTWRWQLSASVPIFEGFAREGQIERAVGQRRAQHEALDREEKLVVLEVKDSFLSIRKERESLHAAGSSVRFAEENLRLQQALYESGAGTLLEWDNANLDLRRARLLLIQAQINLLRAHVRFWKAVGQ